MWQVHVGHGQRRRVQPRVHVADEPLRAGAGHDHHLYAAAEARHEAGQEAAEEANLIKVDIASKKGDHIGPVVSKVQYDKIINLIENKTKLKFILK